MSRPRGASALSLRARLTVVILLPLLLIAGLIAFWSVSDARTRADERFNLALLTAALAVSRDVALSGGDALSPRTTALLRDTSGGQVFYHVYAPDGVFVTGYATPPVPVAEVSGTAGAGFYDGLHQSREVRAVRFVDAMQLEGLSGDFTVTVWQDRALWQARVAQMSWRSLQIMGLLILTVALVVWFGVRLGLRPLNDIEAAVARRSSHDLAPIKRAVPAEVQGLVAVLNRLFAQVSRSMTAQSEFVANAAHQLRNPIAGVLALAEAVVSAPDPKAARRRAEDLLTAARETSELGQKLLLLERAEAVSPEAAQASLDLSQALGDWAQAIRAGLPAGVEMRTSIEAGHAMTGDATMLREAVTNLVDNALRHGGPGLSLIEISLRRSAQGLSLGVADDGAGLAAQDVAKAMERFAQVAPSSSSGLGLSIVQAVAQAHGGELRLHPSSQGLRAVIAFPS